jgi:hypothetical protein
MQESAAARATSSEHVRARNDDRKTGTAPHCRGCRELRVRGDAEGGSQEVGSGMANSPCRVAGVQVVVLLQVSEGHGGRVEQSDAVGASKNQVLGWRDREKAGVAGRGGEKRGEGPRG